jgi:lysophospholipase L1-like esterase
MKHIKISLCLMMTVLMAVVASGAISTTPNPRLRSHSWMSLSRWFQMHAEDVALATAGESKLVFWGDSITEGWNGNGQKHWEEHFAPLGAVNFGIGGDMTQNLLWRLEHGSAGNLNPDRVVLLIGTNNFGWTNESPTQVAAGIRWVIFKLREVYPNAEVLLMAVFPRSEAADHPDRARIIELNKLIQPLGDLEKITYLDIGTHFLLKDGTLSKELMPDFLHLSDKGYAIWCKAIVDWIDNRSS